MSSVCSPSLTDCRPKLDRAVQNFIHRRRQIMKPSLIFVALVVSMAGAVQADPLTNEVIKFYQLPLNNTFVPLPPGAVYTNVVYQLPLNNTFVPLPPGAVYTNVFYQLPLNNTFVPLPPGAVYTNGAPTPFPGHDE